MSRSSIISFLAAAVLAACTTDPYDTGDGSYSYLCADLVEANTNSLAQIATATTDNGTTLLLTTPLTTSWAAQADTLYRALLYYNLQTATDDGTTVAAEPVSIGQVPVLTLIDGPSLDEMATDPVTFISAWKAKSGKYLNVNLSVKTGTADGEMESQVIGMVCDSIADGDSKTVYMTLYHAQNGQPEYYSSELYASVPLADLDLSAGDTIRLRVNTYSGLTERVIAF